MSIKIGTDCTVKDDGWLNGEKKEKEWRENGEALNPRSNMNLVHEPLLTSSCVSYEWEVMAAKYNLLRLHCGITQDLVQAFIDILQSPPKKNSR